MFGGDKHVKELCKMTNSMQIMTAIVIIMSSIFIHLAALGLHCCAQASSSCGEKGPLSCGPGVSCGGGFFCSGARALRLLGLSKVAMHAFSSWNTWA